VDGRRLTSTSWTDTAQVPLSQDEESGDFYSCIGGSPVTGTHLLGQRIRGPDDQRGAALDALVLRFGRTPEENYPALQAWRSRVLDVLASS